MKVAFYKGRSRLFNRAVSFWLRGPYSHCELIVGEAGGKSQCLSSSFMDGGVRFKSIELDPAHWDIVEIDGSIAQAWEWFMAHRGQGYDILGLVGFLLRPVSGDKSRWFCSEAVASMLGFEEPWRFDPMVLWAALSRRRAASLTGGGK